MDWLEDAAAGAAGGNVRTYSVEELSRRVKTTIEDAFGWIRVRGEVSSVSAPRSGHIYLTFKQDRHELAAVVWRSKAARLTERPREGIEYIASGTLTAYSGTSRYQLIVDRLEPAGEGALLAMIEERKRRLQSEGLFDQSRKQPIPFLPNVIGVISSPGGAVIRDISRVLRDRFPRHVVLWPVAVQGENCAAEVARAIDGFNRIGADSSVPRPDLLIVARGGGSMEDLLGFSEEIVVRAAFESRIPIISAVGHETDTPLIDLAADLRAPTPSVAAEKAVPAKSELLTRLSSLQNRLVSAASRSTDRRLERLRDVSRGLPKPERLFEVPSQRLDSQSEKMATTILVRIQTSELELGRLSARLRLPEVVGRAERRLAGLSARLQPRLVEVRISGGSVLLERAASRLKRSAVASVQGCADRLAGTTRLLKSLDYKQVLGRGYALVRHQDDVVTTRAEALVRDKLEIQFQDGSVPVDVKSR